MAALSDSYLVSLMAATLGSMPTTEKPVEDSTCATIRGIAREGLKCGVGVHKSATSDHSDRWLCINVINRTHPLNKSGHVISGFLTAAPPSLAVKILREEKSSWLSKADAALAAKCLSWEFGTGIYQVVAERSYRTTWEKTAERLSQLLAERWSASLVFIIDGRFFAALDPSRFALIEHFDDKTKVGAHYEMRYEGSIPVKHISAIITPLEHSREVLKAFPGTRVIVVDESPVKGEVDCTLLGLSPPHYEASPFDKYAPQFESVLSTLLEEKGSHPVMGVHVARLSTRDDLKYGKRIVLPLALTKEQLAHISTVAKAPFEYHEGILTISLYDLARKDASGELLRKSLNIAQIKINLPLAKQDVLYRLQEMSDKCALFRDFHAGPNDFYILVSAAHEAEIRALVS